MDHTPQQTNQNSRLLFDWVGRIDMMDFQALFEEPNADEAIKDQQIQAERPRDNLSFNQLDVKTLDNTLCVQHSNLHPSVDSKTTSKTHGTFKRIFKMFLEEM